MTREDRGRLWYVTGYPSWYIPDCATWDRVETASASALCPDLLRYEQIGEADGWRGRLVRAFFWLLQVWPPR